jgi:transcriptional regulator with XRE-family HTH domain
MIEFDAMREAWLKDPEIRAEYDALEGEFSISEALIRARAKANMTQEQVAEKMQTSQSYVARLESGRVSPSMKALQRYAAATGAKLKISLEHKSAA